jgi:hypothetical protein
VMRCLRLALLCGGATAAAAMASGCSGAALGPTRQAARDAMISCSLQSPGHGKKLLFTRRGHVRTSSPSIELEWSPTRHAYVCVYRDQRGRVIAKRPLSE